MFKSSASFDRTLDKATSQLLLEPDWESVMLICDTLRQGDVQPKYALQQIKKKINNTNPHVSLYALQVLESLVKNCGSPIHKEVATKEFMEEIRELIKTCSDVVKEKVLELIQVWSHAFRNDSQYKAIQDTFHLMKMEGYTFPELCESDAMFAAESAPEWEDADCCHRCRVQFSMMQRKHHCRSCGQVFCTKCSSKNSTIPKFGIEKEVRVCEACFDQLNKGKQSTSAAGTSAAPGTGSATSSPAHAATTGTSSSQPAGKTPEEIAQAEEEELQLAIALSQSEAEEKEKQKKKLTSMYSEQTRAVSSPTPLSTAPTMETIQDDVNVGDVDPELARYLNRSVWEQKQQEETSGSRMQPRTSPTAPSATTTVSSAHGGAAPVKVQEQYQNGEVDEVDDFVNALRSQIEIFVNRMKSNSARGRHISNDSAVQSLFMTITAMHPQLLSNMNNQDEKRAQFEGLQDKLTQVKDAREALDALREEHREKLRREAEEAQRQRQIQMVLKLEDMRKKKAEYLEYQRQLALQRMQEQEQELQLRKQQQLQQTQQQQLRGNVPPQLAQAYGQSQYIMPGVAFSPDGSPLHMQQQGGYVGGMDYSAGGQQMMYNNQMQQGYQQYAATSQQSADYNAAYNMQGMAQALPSQDQQQQPYQQQQPAVTTSSQGYQQPTMQYSDGQQQQQGGSQTQMYTVTQQPDVTSTSQPQQAPEQQQQQQQPQQQPQQQQTQPQEQLITFD